MSVVKGKMLHVFIGHLAVDLRSLNLIKALAQFLGIYARKITEMHKRPGQRS